MEQDLLLGSDIIETSLKTLAQVVILFILQKKRSFEL